MLLPALLLLPAPVRAQNLGAYLTTCASSAPFPAVDTGIVNGYRLGSRAVCLPSATPPDDGFQLCPAPSLLDAYFTDTDVYFRCASSLSPTCNAGCPPGTFCISTLLPSSSLPFYLCGVPCAGGFYLCDDTATKHINSQFTTFCDPVADQCGTCTSSASLLDDGGCTPSAVVSALPVRASSRKRHIDTVVRAHRLPQTGASTGLHNEIEDMDCPPKSRKCPIRGDWEW
ncbi:hypothetical protein QFC19_000699 [Naganishia cerealis]|uniref:Uncharacterized protein n=1 Tax=Naganishia cerealis TaxID=610337 RepID=A0ACC2WLS6_9TREE|nr:hypothetical protein QFC19_000699 [Naganishia cerealis]